MFIVEKNGVPLIIASSEDQCRHYIEKSGEKDCVIREVTEEEVKEIEK